MELKEKAYIMFEDFTKEELEQLPPTPKNNVFGDTPNYMWDGEKWIYTTLD